MSEFLPMDLKTNTHKVSLCRQHRCIDDLFFKLCHSGFKRTYLSSSAICPTIGVAGSLLTSFSLVIPFFFVVFFSFNLILFLFDISFDHSVELKVKLRMEQIHSSLQLTQLLSWFACFRSNFWKGRSMNLNILKVWSRFRFSRAAWIYNQIHFPASVSNNKDGLKSRHPRVPADPIVVRS